MSNSFRMLGTLTVFGLVSGLLLAITNSATRVPIANAMKAETLLALKKVLPDSDNDALADSIHFEESNLTFYIAKKDGVFVGAAVITESEGYGGPVRVVSGFKSDGSINAIQIISADKETPGLGSKIKENSFLSQFLGRTASETSWCKVKKDGGAIEAITGATISSRAVANAVKKGADSFAKHIDKINSK